MGGSRDSPGYGVTSIHRTASPITTGLIALGHGLGTGTDAGSLWMDALWWRLGPEFGKVGARAQESLARS